MIAIALTIVILVLFNVSIHDREQTIANGETLFLKLAPADPRSLMQGDYMQLRYAVENAAQAGRPRGLGLDKPIYGPPSAVRSVRINAGPPKISPV